MKVRTIRRQSVQGELLCRGMKTYALRMRQNVSCGISHVKASEVLEVDDP